MSSEIPSFKGRMLKVSKTLERVLDHKGEAVGLPTGFKDLDRILGGLQTGGHDCHCGAAEYGQNGIGDEYCGACGAGNVKADSCLLA
jgi:replicative DNA helicase